jgi:hypothetical protein
VKLGAETIGGIIASKRLPSSGNSHSRTGLSRLIVVRSVEATVPIRASACIAVMVPTCSMSLPSRSIQSEPSGFNMISMISGSLRNVQSGSPSSRRSFSAIRLRNSSGAPKGACSYVPFILSSPFSSADSVRHINWEGDPFKKIGFLIVRNRNELAREPRQCSARWPQTSANPRQHAPRLPVETCGTHTGRRSDAGCENKRVPASPRPRCACRLCP